MRYFVYKRPVHEAEIDKMNNGFKTVAIASGFATHSAVAQTGNWGTDMVVSQLLDEDKTAQVQHQTAVERYGIPKMLVASENHENEVVAQYIHENLANWSVTSDDLSANGLLHSEFRDACLKQHENFLPTALCMVEEREAQTEKEGIIFMAITTPVALLIAGMYSWAFGGAPNLWKQNPPPPHPD